MDGLLYAYVFTYTCVQMFDYKKDIYSMISTGVVRGEEVGKDMIRMARQEKKSSKNISHGMNPLKYR